MQPISARDSLFGKLLGNPSASKGGYARASSLSPTKRSQIAKKAAIARWGKEKEERVSIPSIEETTFPVVDYDNLSSASFTKHIRFGA